ncbi:MAG TPA: class F sortase [Pseudonocardiaceae bacterium]|nr:class F sortase [Pseudonocardiaceae bacterium]
MPAASVGDPRDRRGRPALVATSAVVGLLGAALLVTGSTQVLRHDLVTGLPETSGDSYQIATHQAGSASQLLAGHSLQSGPVGSAIIGATPSRTAPTSGPTSAPPTSTTPAKPPAGQLPNTIRLPHGGTAYLLHGQVAADGSLPIPPGVNQATWWGSALDAQTGATVFAGHVNWAGRTGPFAELWQDKVGDIVSIRDTGGTLWQFRVSQVITLSKAQVPQQAPALFSPSGPHRIALATCGGEWIGGQLGYADNRVVIATPIS